MFVLSHQKVLTGLPTQKNLFWIVDNKMWLDFNSESKITVKWKSLICFIVELTEDLWNMKKNI